MDQKKAYIDYKNNILMSLVKTGDQGETSSSEIGDSFDSSVWLIFHLLFALLIKLTISSFLYIMLYWANKDETLLW